MAYVASTYARLLLLAYACFWKGVWWVFRVNWDMIRKSSFCFVLFFLFVFLFCFFFLKKRSVFSNELQLKVNNLYIFISGKFQWSHQRCFVRKDVLKIFAIFAGKLVLAAVLNKVAELKTCNFIKKRLQHQCFPVNITKYLRTLIFKSICERLLRKIGSQILKNRIWCRVKTF